MAETKSKTRELLEQLASTEYRRSMRADQIFRSLREETRKPRGGAAAQKA